mgnify:CR=1 FL=1
MRNTNFDEHSFILGRQHTRLTVAYTFMFKGLLYIPCCLCTGVWSLMTYTEQREKRGIAVRL